MNVSTYELIVYGCQMNDYDGEKLAGIMEEAGYGPAAPGDVADVVLVYTCAVRESATARAHGRITSLARYKKVKPETVIGVGGCWPVVEKEVIEKACPHVDFTFGTTSLEEVPATVAHVRGQIAPSTAEEVPLRRAAWPRANVSIMRGCDNFCAYCIVPYARGREVCRPVDDVLREVDELIGVGFKDITLIGQNVNSYRHGGTSFAELLARVDARCDGAFLRFTTNHPRDVDDETVAVLGEGRNVARHLHLPLQSGSDAVLRAMNRGYDVGRYLDIVDKVRQAVPGICMTTDILVGFPGETEDDFAATLNLVERVRYDSAYVFMYSPRAGTAAAALADDVPRPEKTRRLQTVGERQRAIALEINERMVGEEKIALVEGASRKRAGEFAGRLSENKIVNFGGDARIGYYARLKITGGSSWTLRGEPAP
jgi:tRNA-2-methylthio-N6-dimethylallyladenosine synthase